MDNNILVISEKEQKAYLPYKYEEIQKIYESPINSKIFQQLDSEKLLT